jgi:hypothetical protein
MFNKLICYFLGHQPIQGIPYTNFIDDDGLSKVKCPIHIPCKRCGFNLIRRIEPYEWSLIVIGKAVFKD